MTTEPGVCPRRRACDESPALHSTRRPPELTTTSPRTVAGPVLLAVRVTTTTGDLGSMTALTTTWSAEQTARRVHGLSSPPTLGPLRARPYAPLAECPQKSSRMAPSTHRESLLRSSQRDSFKGASGEEACRVTCRGVIRCVTSGETPRNLFNLISELGKLPVFFPGLWLTLHTRSASKERACESDTIPRSSFPPSVLSSAASTTRARAQSWSPHLSVQIARFCLELRVSGRDRGSEGDTRNSATSGDRRADDDDKRCRCCVPQLA